jgi:putative ABC transport system permease protein
MLRMLLAAVVLVLLVACANIASLFLVRGAARRRELAVRSALGASRGRLVRPLLVEAATLAVAAGALGLLMSRALVDALIAIGPADLPRVAEVAIDLRVAHHAGRLARCKRPLRSRAGAAGFGGRSA